MPALGRSDSHASRIHVTIIGLGLIGASLGLALRSTGKYTVVGHDISRDAMSVAKKKGAVDSTEWNLPASLERADLVVIATPVLAVESTLRDIAPNLKPGAVVTDTASTKASVMKWADEILPVGIGFVGGHPMAGKETSGPGNADGGIFNGCTYCVVMSERATQTAADALNTLITDVGAAPFFVDAVEHDSYVAAVSHLPFLTSIALAATATRSSGWRDLKRVAAGGFRDATRLASGDPVMHRDICLTNREPIRHWLRQYRQQLDELAEAMDAEDGEALLALFEATRKDRDAWQAERTAAETARAER